jgi:hypothetical protein
MMDYPQEGEVRVARSAVSLETVSTGTALLAFLAEWRKALNEPSVDWDGRRAYTELRRKKVWDFVRCENEWKDDWRSNDFVFRIHAELGRYREESELWNRKSLVTRKALKKEDAYLAKLDAGLGARLKKTTISVLRNQLLRVSESVREARLRLKHFATLREKTKFVTSPLGGWELLFPEHKSKAFVERGLDLDSRLQLQLGKLMTLYLGQSRVTLKTICRLIILAYLVSDLAILDDKTDNCRTVSTDRQLDLENIHQFLVDAGFRKNEV